MVALIAMEFVPIFFPAAAVLAFLTTVLQIGVIGAVDRIEVVSRALEKRVQEYV